MSFADIANGVVPVRENRLSLAARSNHPSGSNNTVADCPLKALHQSKQTMEAASFRLEQFQRQTIAIKRFAASLNSKKLYAKASVSEDTQSRIRFATHLQGEIADSLKNLPQSNGNALMKRKLCKDFQMISSQLETAVRDIAQYEQKVLKENQHDLESSKDDRLHVEHNGQMLEFQALKQDIAQNEAIIEERERDITQIHQSVAQVNEIFRDLAAIVEDQQVAIDAIDNHVGESLMKTKQGLDQVRKAADSQRTCIIQ